MKRINYFILILFALLLITGCEKKKTKDIEVVKQEEITKKAVNKELNCEYDMTAQLGGLGVAKYTFTLVQENNELTEGYAKLVIDYTDYPDITEESLKAHLSEMEKTFCGRDYYGEGTTKECKLTSHEKILEANIIIDVDEFLKSSGINKKDINEHTLEGVKENIEKANSSLSAKCTLE